jgi:hypothetical protein
VEGTTDRIADETGNGYTGLMVNGATLDVEKGVNILRTGSSNGYVDMGGRRGVGRLIRNLRDFTIAIYINIDPSVYLGTFGHFVWCFANSNNMAEDANGNMFFGARRQRQAISKTHFEGEEAVQIGEELEQGVWKHILYRQSGTTGTLFIDGIEVVSGRVNLFPANLGATNFNYLAKPCYVGDHYLRETKLHDFRIYSTALSNDEIAKLDIINKLNLLN